MLDRPYGRVGVLLGSEVMVMEVSRLLANSGCDVLAIPAVKSPTCPGCCPRARQAEEEYHLARVRANENNTYAAFAAQEGMSGIFGPDMFPVPRNEVIVRENGFGEMALDARFILMDGQGRPAVNVAREKPMLGTRHTIWYDRLIEQTECVL